MGRDFKGAVRRLATPSFLSILESSNWMEQLTLGAVYGLPIAKRSANIWAKHCRHPTNRAVLLPTYTRRLTSVCETIVLSAGCVRSVFLSRNVAGFVGAFSITAQALPWNALLPTRQILRKRRR